MQITWHECKEEAVRGSSGTNSTVWSRNLEYGSSREEEIDCNGDEVSEEYVWSNTNGSGEE